MINHLKGVSDLNMTNRIIMKADLIIRDSSVRK